MGVCQRQRGGGEFNLEQREICQSVCVKSCNGGRLHNAKDYYVTKSLYTFNLLVLNFIIPHSLRSEKPHAEDNILGGGG